MRGVEIDLETSSDPDFDAARKIIDGMRRLKCGKPLQMMKISLERCNFPLDWHLWELAEGVKDPQSPTAREFWFCMEDGHPIAGGDDRIEKYCNEPGARRFTRRGEQSDESGDSDD